MYAHGDACDWPNRHLFGVEAADEEEELWGMRMRLAAGLEGELHSPMVALGRTMGVIHAPGGITKASNSHAERRDSVHW